MTAKEYLKQARHLDQLIRCDQKSLEELNHLSTSIPALDYSKEKVASSGNSPHANYTFLLEKKLELEGRIKGSMAESMRLKLEIRDKLENIFPIEQRLILDYRYLQQLKWEEIGVKMGISKRTANRLHGLALKKISVP